MRESPSYKNTRLRIPQFIIVMLFLISGSCGDDDGLESPDEGLPRVDSLDFSDQTVGTQFFVRDTITSNGVRVAVDSFQWSSGVWQSGGAANIDDRERSGGNAPDVNTDNCNLEFLFEYPGMRITLKFGEYLGNNNIRINGLFQNVPDLASLDGVTLDGVLISVPAGRPTSMTLDGLITGFAIGGQELWVDDVYFTRLDDRTGPIGTKSAQSVKHRPSE